MTAGQHIPAFFFFYVSKLIMCQVSVEYMTEHTTIMLCDKEKKYSLKCAGYHSPKYRTWDSKRAATVRYKTAHQFLWQKYY
jgi:hypothetical protein